VHAKHASMMSESSVQTQAIDRGVLRDRQRGQGRLVILTACIPSLIHCCAPRRPTGISRCTECERDSWGKKRSLSFASPNRLLSYYIKSNKRIRLYENNEVLPSMTLSDADGVMHSLTFQGKWSVLRVGCFACDVSDLEAISDLNLTLPRSRFMDNVTTNAARNVRSGSK
jgi:hypothetical protein